jgi:hypothetical protein
MVNIPSLDAHAKGSIPFFAQQAAGVRGAVGEPAITFRMKDAPKTEVPCQAMAPNGEEVPLKQLRVEDKFTLSLYDKTAHRVLQQWEWGYGFILETEIQKGLDLKANGFWPNPSHKNLKIRYTGKGKARDVSTPNTSIVLTGPVANDNSNKVWQNGWVPWKEKSKWNDHNDTPVGPKKT